MRFGNIRVGQDVIGTLNIGHLQVIDVAVSHIQHDGDLPLAHALWEFTQAVIESREVEPATRSIMIEQLAFLSEQTAVAKSHGRMHGRSWVI